MFKTKYGCFLSCYVKVLLPIWWTGGRTMGVSRLPMTAQRAPCVMTPGPLATPGFSVSLRGTQMASRSPTLTTVRAAAISWWTDWAVTATSRPSSSVGTTAGWRTRAPNVATIRRTPPLSVTRMVSTLYKETYRIVGEIDFIELGFISYPRFG